MGQMWEQDGKKRFEALLTTVALINTAIRAGKAPKKDHFFFQMWQSVGVKPETGKPHLEGEEDETRQSDPLSRNQDDLC